MMGQTQIASTVSSMNINDTAIEEVQLDDDLSLGTTEEILEDENNDCPRSGEKGQCSTLRKRRSENAALTNAVIALSESLTQPKKPDSVQREEDECDIFGKLVAKRMRTIKTDVIRMLAEQEILNTITNKICEDQGLLMTPMPQVVGNN